MSIGKTEPSFAAAMIVSLEHPTSRSALLKRCSNTILEKPFEENKVSHL